MYFKFEVNVTPKAYLTYNQTVAICYKLKHLSKTLLIYKTLFSFEFFFPTSTKSEASRAYFNSSLNVKISNCVIMCKISVCSTQKLNWTIAGSSRCCSKQIYIFILFPSCGSKLYCHNSYLCLHFRCNGMSGCLFRNYLRASSKTCKKYLINYNLSTIALFAAF